MGTAMMTTDHLISRYFQGINMEDVDRQGTSMYTTRPDETLIASHATETYCNTAHFPVLSRSDRVYYGGVLKVRDTHYTIDLQTGKITYITAPTTGQRVSATYKDTETFKFYLDQSIESAEKLFDMKFSKSTITDERTDWDWRNAIQWSNITTRYTPLRTLTSVKYKFPSGSEVTIPTDWFYATETGNINLVPSWGTFSTFMITAGGYWYPTIYQHDYIPGCVYLTYDAGFDATDVPTDIVHYIGLMAAIPIFDILGDLILGAGIATQSIGIDGLSQGIGSTSSATNAGYGARIITYTKEANHLRDVIKNYYKASKRIFVV